MLEVLRKSPLLRLEGNKTITLQNVRLPAKTLSLSAEALTQPSPSKGEDKGEGEKPVALVFGPENGAVSEKLVYEAAREAHAKSYTHLYVIGFAIQPNARTLVDKCGDVMGMPATYVQATPDLMMGDLLKNMRSSQIFSVCGLPEIKVHGTVSSPHPKGEAGRDTRSNCWVWTSSIRSRWRSPTAAAMTCRPGSLIRITTTSVSMSRRPFSPAPARGTISRKRSRASTRKACGTICPAPRARRSTLGEHRQIAVKVIDDRGNELLVMKKLA